MRTGLLALSLALFAAGGAASPTPNPTTTREIFHFANATFIENIALRPNGHLLLDTFDNGRMYTIDPSAPDAKPHVAAQFPAVTSLTGIVEVAPDVFAVSGGIPSATNPFAFELGTAKVFLINFRDCGAKHGQTKVPEVQKIAEMPDANILNGMTHLPAHPHIILTVDSVDGHIFRVDTSTGAVDVAIQDAKLAIGNGNATTPLGANGIKVHDGYLYFANSAQLFFGRVAITPEGNRAGDVEKIVSVLDRATMAYDDFAITKDGTAYVATHPSYLSKITSDGKETIIVGADDQTILYGPTSVILSRDGKKAYVTTGGAASDGVGTTGGQLVEVSL